MKQEIPLQKKFLACDFKAAEADGKLFISGYANTKNVADRYGDVPTVYKSKRDFVYDIAEYKRNPVLLLDHERGIDHLLGKVAEIHEDETGLFFKAEIMDSELPLIKHAREAIKQGIAKAISIGGRWHYEDEKNPSLLTLAEIFEISLVTVPADPNALAMPVEKSATDNWQKELTARFEKEISSLKSEIAEIRSRINSDVKNQEAKQLSKIADELKAMKKTMLGVGSPDKGE